MLERNKDPKKMKTKKNFGYVFEEHRKLETVVVGVLVDADDLYSSVF